MGKYDFVFRKKKINDDDGGESKNQLARTLTIYDLIFLGIGSTLGAGIYVLAGSVIKNVSGPSVVISFVVAAVASVLAGLCYAEFGARVPKTGSAYVYTYVTIGELMAFIIGWNLILEYVIGTSSVARAFSIYFDSLVDYRIRHFFKSYLPINLLGISHYPDLFAFVITLIITVILAIGVKESSRMNNIFTGVNLLVVSFIIIFGAMKSDFHNWSLKPNELFGVKNQTNGTQHMTNSSHVYCHNTTVGHHYSCGKGGFFPFGISGMLAGAAKCFYAFVGFDCIATTGEEVKNPQRAIPISIIISLLVCTIAYCGVSAVLSLMVPYFMINENAPIPDAFEVFGWSWTKYIVTIGAICSLTSSLFGSFFPLPRIVYAISSDGLIFEFLSRVSEKFKSPLVATIVCGLFSALLAMLLELNELIDLMSIGTLLAYTLVAVSVLLLRYEINEETMSETDFLLKKIHESKGKQMTLDALIESNKHKIPQTQNDNNNNQEHKNSKSISLLLTIIVIDLVLVCMILIISEDSINRDFWAGLTFIILVMIALITTFILSRQPQAKKLLSFQMPFVPVLPVLSIFINLYLMLVLNYRTWVRFLIWMFIGFLIYFGYGIRNSKAKKQEQTESYLYDKPTAVN